MSVASGQTLKDMRLTMVATGAISGRVSDNRGEPIANVPVQALKYSYQAGERKLSVVKTESTNDRGEYRLFWLPPGTYFVSASAGPGGLADIFMFAPDTGGNRAIRISANGLVVNGDRPDAEKLGEADAPVYYPGTPDSRAATPVDLRPGADLSGIDFSLTRLKTRRIRGTIVDSASGQPKSTNIMLIPRQPSVAGPLRTGVSSDGSFEFKNVLPGSYYLVAERRRAGDPVVERVMGARVPVDVGASDIEQATVTLSPAVNISGEVTFEGGNGTGNDTPHPVVTLRNQYPGMPAFAQIYASFKDNSQLTVDDVLEGKYRVVLEDMPKGAYVRSIRYGADDVLNGPLSIDARSSDRLRILVSMNGGTLDGTVFSPSRETVGNGEVTLVPDVSHRERVDLYKKATTDETGKFHLDGIPPGDHSLFAWEDIDDSLWRDPEFIRRNEASGRPVHIVESGNENVELTAILVEF